MNEYPNNPAHTDYEIDPLLKKRWSPYAISDEKIEQTKINSLFEAARWAPSSFNEQPWRIIYATKENPDQYKKLADLLAEGNAWASNAYMLMLICAKPNFAYNDKANRNHQYDTGAAIQNLFLQATSMGLVAHEMAGFDADRAHEALSIPKDVSVLAMMALGYRGNKEALSSELKSREDKPRERKKVEEFVFEGEWKA
jgi:nitroreductase